MITETRDRRQLAGLPVWEHTLVLRNEGTEPVTVTRADALAMPLDGTWSTLAFTSSWGLEGAPVHGSTADEVHLESRSGRSSHGHHPWLGLERAGEALIVSPAWSGNWHIDLDAGHLTAGISPWRFAVELGPGETFTAPSVVVASGPSIEDAAVALTTAIGRDWTPRSTASDRLDVEWNHWWPYEDAEVTEEVIAENASIAAELGIRVVTVDAGWFGAPGETYWPEQRGDWEAVNTERFPSGLAALGAAIRERGPRAGIWLEAEAVGASARLRTEHPELLALGDGTPPDPSYKVNTVSLDPADPTFLGYLCLGSAAAREYVAGTLDRIVAETGAEWVKLDFNVDPGAGCTRTDHGHGAGDGLLRHYEGLYALLDAFRERHPAVVLEACSSGGLRIDLGLARHVHCLFLSDPDYTEHHLEVLWAVSLMLPPVAMLHWSWSQWRGDHGPSQLDFASLSRDAFDTILRAALLQRFGISMRLPELSGDQLDAIRTNVALFNDTLAQFVRDGVLHRLTPQPLREGAGERVPAFQLVLGDRSVVAVFVLAGGEAPGYIQPIGAAATVTDLATGESVDLDAAGIPLAAGPTSWLFLVEP